MQLYELWRQHPKPPISRSQQEIARALVHLRRAGDAYYNANDDIRRRRAEPGISKATLDDILYWGLATGTIVNIVGERYPGVVVHTETWWDQGDLYPGIWYVVAVPALSRCRSHGSDEIEPVIRGQK